MNRIELINRMEEDLVTLREMTQAFEVEVAGLDVVGDDVWARGSQIARSVIDTRKQVVKLKLDEGGYPLHVDVPPRIAGHMD